MSALARHQDHAARRLTTQRVRAARRSRRADAGAVTEIARSLLRDAREADERAWARERITPGALAAPRA
jgi:hypothetical protein